MLVYLVLQEELSVSLVPGRLEGDFLSLLYGCSEFWLVIPRSPSFLVRCRRLCGVLPATAQHTVLDQQAEELLLEPGVSPKIRSTGSRGVLPKSK